MAASFPFVSVVIPVYNDAPRLRQTLEALQKQTYPSDCYEVIVVDNGSTDESVQVARGFSDVEVLIETQHTGSPYSARNRGIEVARGEIIALLDSTCVPVEHWMEKGVECMTAGGADLVGGDVAFSFQGDPTPGELFDALTNIRMRESVKQGRAKTANLFVRRNVFDGLGLFPERIRSGGDVRWTQRAVTENYVLAFCEEARVHKSARSLLPLLKKQWRVGKAHPKVWREDGREIGLIKVLTLALIPPSRAQLRKTVQESRYPEAEKHLWTLWLVNYLARFITRLGQGYTLAADYLYGDSRSATGPTT